MRLQLKLTNILLGVVWNTIFRKSYSPQLMRKLFDLVAGASKEQLLESFPKSIFRSHPIQNVPTELIAASNDPKMDRTILYLHGGGYFMGSIHAYRRFALKLSFVTKCKVLLVEYRLAPENPYPAGLDDIFAVYQDLLKTHPPEKLIIGGDSAGGGLTMALLLRLKKFNVPLPGKAFAICPWVDIAAVQETYQTNHGKDVWLTKGHMDCFGKYYVAGQDINDPLISPINGEFSGMPPTAFFVGDQEVLLGECLALHENYKKNKSSSQLFVGKDLQHTWMIAAPNLKESKQFYKDLHAFLHS